MRRSQNEQNSCLTVYLSHGGALSLHAHFRLDKNTLVILDIYSVPLYKFLARFLEFSRGLTLGQSLDFKPKTFGGIMKTKSKILLAALSVLVITACGKNKNDSSKAAGVPGSFNAYANTCMNSANQNAWAGYSQYGIRPYYSGYRSHGYPQYSNASPAVFNNQAQGFCGCDPGYMPACDSANGMACVRANRFTNHRPATWSYNYQYRQVYAGQYGMPTYSARYNSQHNSQYSCYSSFAQMCTVGLSDSCSLSGGICRPTSRNSSHGVCVRY